MRIFKRKATYGKKQERFSIDFTDHAGKSRRLAAFKDRRLTERFALNLESLIDYRRAAQPSPGALREWTDALPEAMKKRLQLIGLLSSQELESSQPIEKHLRNWEKHLDSKNASKSYIIRATRRVEIVFAECRFQTLLDVKRARVEKWLNAKQNSGMIAATRNGYLKSAKAFCSWARASEIVSSHPLEFIKASPETASTRRALTDPEARTLLAYTKTSQDHFGLTGEERALIYGLALSTGMRWGEIQKTQRGDFCFAQNGSHMRIRAASAKNGKESRIPLQKNLAEAILAYMQQTLAIPTVPLFRNMRATRGAAMLRRDLTGAGIESDSDDGKVDFHALRHSFATALMRANVHPSTAQALLRHSDVRLTLSRYTHTTKNEEQEAVDLLPEYLCRVLTEEEIPYETRGLSEGVENVSGICPDSALRLVI